MVNAVEDCVASESETASQGRSVPPASVANVTGRSERRTERSFEGRLLSRLLTFLGDPPLEFVLWTGESVVEAGCGWGSLAIHMAQRYGVKVRAFNISQEQVAFARERAQREGFGSSVEFVLDDYRNITGKYDAFVSVGMLEHVGVEHYPALGRVISHCLGNVGRGLIHSIGRNFPAQMHPWIEKRIFPGAHPPSLGEMMQIFEPWNLSILDVENIRLHYAQTLRHWLELYEGASDKVAEMFDEKFVRMWRLYLAGSVAAFTTGTLQLFQVLFAPGQSNDVPLTRDYMYAR